MGTDPKLNDPEASMTWLDLVRMSAAVHHIEVDDVDADWVLWEHTAFPLADAAYVARQLDEFFAVVAAEQKGTS